MKAREVRFAFIPPGETGSVFACVCGGIQVYASVRDAAICFRCGRAMKYLAEVKACAPQRPLGRLVMVKGGAGQ